MKPADGKILFKQWLPDVAPLDNPGLVECQNALPLDGVYKSFAPLTGTETAGPARPVSATWSSIPITGGMYVASAQQIYRYISGYSVLSASTYNSNAEYWRFAEYEGLMVATNYFDFPQAHTVGASTAFTALATSGTAPAAQHVGVVGQFVVLGNLKDASGTARPYSVQWSGIDQPRSWPAPNSSTAIAQQSGLEDLNGSLGEVMAVVGNDQFGVVMQQGGLTRMTYVGGSVVFQFDEYEVGRGLLFPNSIVQVGNLVYYISNAGFCVTDGTQVRNIGAGKVDNYFRSQVNFGYKFQVFGAADYQRELVYWSFCSQTSGSVIPDQLLIYNWTEDRWSRASNTHTVLVSPYQRIGALQSPRPVNAFFASNTLGSFSGTAGAAVFESGEIEYNLGSFSRVQGIKPLIDTASVTVAIGTRNDQVSSPTYTSEVTANSRTGFADFRSEARYHRARLTVTGTFNAAQGVEFQGVVSGAV